MKKFYSIVLMATMLLVGTNVWAVDVPVNGGTGDDLQTAINSAASGSTIKLTQDVVLTPQKPIWLGTSDTVAANAKSLTLDLNGFNITCTPTTNDQYNYMIVLSHGELIIKNSVPGDDKGQIKMIQGANVPHYYSNIIAVYGKYQADSVDTGIAETLADGLYSHLVIEDGVKIVGTRGAGIHVDVARDQNNNAWYYMKNWTTKMNYTTDIFQESGGYPGVAFGVRVDVKGDITMTPSGERGYCVKTNGILRNPRADKDRALRNYSFLSGVDVTAHDSINVPFIRIYSTSELKASGSEKKAAAIYAGGYGRWLVEGECEGATGVYVRSGEIELNDATVTSTYAGTATTTTGGTSGISSGGSAIVIESNGNYAGDQSVTVNGDTKVETQATGGAAIVDIVDANTESRVENVTINGGTFSGDNGIVISTGTANAGVVEVNGVTVVGNVTVGNKTGEEAIEQIISTTGHQTVVDGTIIITEGSNPNDYLNWDVIAELPDSTDANWTGCVAGVIDNGEVVTLGMLQMTSADGTTGKELQKLTIKGNSTLHVKRLIMNSNARIIVEAGSKLVVYGEQGINAPVADNILLKASETAQAMFLVHPNVKSNRHPNAKVEYQSKSFFNGHNIEQFFGIPTYNGAVTNIETSSDAKIYFDVWRNPNWDYIGAINVPGDPSVMDHLDKFNLPFGLYDITSKNDAEHKPTFTFSGELTGNMDHTFTLYQGWTSMANAYMGPIDGNAILAQLAAWNASYGTEQNIYVYSVNPATGNIQWTAKNKYVLVSGGMNAMAPIMFHNGSVVNGVVLDYSTLVWDPLFPAQNPAPARRGISNITKAQINIAGENEADHTTIVADSELGDDRSFCAPKYDNEGLQLYVTENEKYDIYAADELENSYIGYRTVDAGMYTISFENVQGDELVLVDLVNGVRTNIMEGAIYTFAAEANEANDYRFQVVAAAKMPTSIEETEADASTKKAGVYTLTGQYLGNASIFNTLPAGVYVVDGVKKVK